MTKPKCKCPLGSPFHWHEIKRPSIFADSKIQNSINNSVKQTAHIERERVKGRDISHMPGISKETTVPRTMNVRQFLAYSRAGAPK